MPTVTARLTHPDFGFTVTDESQNALRLDIPADQGGQGQGFRPMQTVLAALCACSGVDIVSILKKQRQIFDSLEIRVEGEREKDKEPALWKTIHIQFLLTGTLEPEKVLRAASLSVDKYCSVAETLRRAGANISFEVWVNQTPYQP